MIEILTRSTIPKGAISRIPAEISKPTFEQSSRRTRVVPTRVLGSGKRMTVSPRPTCPRHREPLLERILLGPIVNQVRGSDSCCSNENFVLVLVPPERGLDLRNGLE